ncbi:MAG: response regulator transcription factor [Bacteroidales bacterium]
MDILVVEDNSRISEFLVKGLEESGFSVSLAENGIDARTEIGSRKWDLILLDIMLPDIDGYELVQFTRFKKINTPILILSALGDVDDKIKALDMGADDYLSKPFHFAELLSRINALLRRRTMYDDTPDKHWLKCDDLVLDIERHQVTRGDMVINLTLQEFMLLKILMENMDRVLTRSHILDSVWGIQHNTNTNIVDVYISYLRNKIDSGDRKIIETVKGRGYIIRSKN